MTCALFKRWVTAMFHIDSELHMSDPRNLGQGDPPHELLVMADEEGLKRTIDTVRPEGKPTPPTSESEAEAGCEYDTGTGPDQPTYAQTAHDGRRPTLGDQGL
jgi:hypothetical protein